MLLVGTLLQYTQVMTHKPVQWREHSNLNIVSGPPIKGFRTEKDTEPKATENWKSWKTNSRLFVLRNFVWTLLLSVHLICKGKKPKKTLSKHWKKEKESFKFPMLSKQKTRKSLKLDLPPPLRDEQLTNCPVNYLAKQNEHLGNTFCVCIPVQFLSWGLAFDQNDVIACLPFHQGLCSLGKWYGCEQLNKNFFPFCSFEWWKVCIERRAS